MIYKEVSEGQELGNTLTCSVSTIRNDLTLMEKNGRHVACEKDKLKIVTEEAVTEDKCNEFAKNGYELIRAEPA